MKLKKSFSIISIILIVAIVLSFPGCSKKSNETSEDTYVYNETKLVLPQEYTQVLDMCVLKSGDFIIAVTNPSNDASVF